MYTKSNSQQHLRNASETLTQHAVDACKKDAKHAEHTKKLLENA